MDKGTVYQVASLFKKTFHVGKIKSKCFENGACPADEMKEVSSWGFAPGKVHGHEKVKAYPARYPMNEDSVGIETVARCLTNCSDKDPDSATWDPPTPEQATAIATIVRILRDTYGITDSDIYGHGNVSYKKAGEGADLHVSGNDHKGEFPPAFVQEILGHEGVSQGYRRGSN